MIEHSSFSIILVSGITALYSKLPNKIPEEFTKKWHLQWTRLEMDDLRFGGLGYCILFIFTKVKVKNKKTMAKKHKKSYSIAQTLSILFLACAISTFVIVFVWEKYLTGTKLREFAKLRSFRLYSSSL